MQLRQQHRRGAAASSRAIQYAEAVEAALAALAAMSCWPCSASLPLTLRALLLTVARVLKKTDSLF